MRSRRESAWSVGVGAWILAIALTLAVAPRPAAAQVVGGSIGGMVTDDTGGALPGVTVIVTNRANGTNQVLTTGERGTYRAVALQPAVSTAFLSRTSASDPRQIQWGFRFAF